MKFFSSVGLSSVEVRGGNPERPWPVRPRVLQGLGWRGHMLQLEMCDFFLGKLAVWLRSKKTKSKRAKQAQNNKIWIHIKYQA